MRWNYGAAKQDRCVEKNQIHFRAESSLTTQWVTAARPARVRSQGLSGGELFRTSAVAYTKYDLFETPQEYSCEVLCDFHGRRDYDITEIDITESDVAEFDITENDITESDITETNITWIGKLL